jgi:predicted transposase/invertase (TIGR01784 family)
MTTGKEAHTGKEVVRKKSSTSKYINPMTDFGFKFIFGTEEYLLDFLNSVLKIEGGIVDLHYDNTERPGRSEDDRTTIFDLYCTTGKGERILIEMQHHWQDFFQNRVLYYASRMIQEQGEDNKGDTWKFKLSPVYSVNIVNFRLNKKKRSKKTQNEKYVSYVQLTDIDTHEIFTDKIVFVFLELPCFTKKLPELATFMDEWMYILKNMSKLNDLPDALRKRIFEKLFHKAEIAKLSKKARKEYEQSLKNLMNMNLIIEERNEKIEVLTQENATYRQEVATYRQENATFRQEVAAKDRIIADLQRRLGLNDVSAN